MPFYIDALSSSFLSLSLNPSFIILLVPSNQSFILLSFLPPVSGEAAIADPSLPLEITITTDEEKGTLTLRDTGKEGGSEGRRSRREA